jgi:hypothetical protein
MCKKVFVLFQWFLVFATLIAVHSFLNQLVDDAERVLAVIDIGSLILGVSPRPRTGQ